jgi:hypothetical protein
VFSKISTINRPPILTLSNLIFASIERTREELLTIEEGERGPAGIRGQGDSDDRGNDGKMVELAFLISVLALLGSELLPLVQK